MFRRAPAAVLLSAVISTFACTQTSDSEVARPPVSPETTVGAGTPPREAPRVGGERLSPILCTAAARNVPVVGSADVPRTGSDIELRFNADPIATFAVGPHNATAPLTYSITAEASNTGTFSYVIRRTDPVDVPAAQLPGRFTLAVHYPAACRQAFATTAPIVLVRVDDATVVPASAHDVTRRTVTFQMNRLSRFVVSH